MTKSARWANAAHTSVSMIDDADCRWACAPDDARLVGLKIAEFDGPPEPLLVAKLDVYARMSDAELAAFNAWYSDRAPLRQRLLWRDSALVNAADRQWADAFKGLFGAARGTVLLRG